MTDKEKIEMIMTDKHLNNTKFCSLVGIAPGTLSHIMSGRTHPTLNILRSMKFVFPDINPAWLFYNEEPMYLADVTPTTPITEDSSSTTSNNIDERYKDAADFYQPDLFAQSDNVSGTNRQQSSRQTLNASTPNDSKKANDAMSAAVSISAVSEIVEQTVKQLQRPVRKVVEVRIFFDDGTFETFCNK